MNDISIGIHTSQTTRKASLRPGGRITIGSRPGAGNIAIEREPGLADIHTIVRRDGDVVTIEDAGSVTGTFVNGRRIRRQELRPGDTATAAGVTIRLITEGSAVERQPAGADGSAARLASPPRTPARAVAQGLVPSETLAREIHVPSAPARFESLPGPAAGPSISAQRTTPAGIAISELPNEDSLAFRKKAGERVFAILDLARNREIHRAILIHPDRHESLYEGERGLEFTAVAPYLVELDSDSLLFGYLRREGWGDSWGIYLISGEEFPGIRRHLRRFLTVKLEDGGEAYFRFYDPRVFRSFLPVCTTDQAGELFASVSAFIAEAENPKRATRYEFTGSPRLSVRPSISQTARGERGR